DSAVTLDFGVNTGRRNFNLIIPSFVPQVDAGLAFDQQYAAGSLEVKMFTFPTTTAPTLNCVKQAAMPAFTSETQEVNTVSCGGSCCYHLDTSTPGVRRFR